MPIYSPLRYPGSKRWLAPFVRQILQANDLLGGTYVEPYAGGAGIALELLFSQSVEQIIINDADRAVWAFWNAVLNHTDELCRLVRDTPINITSWDYQKRVQQDPASEDLQLGFSTFFLNRTNVSGVLNGGVIGGREQTGRYLINARYNPTSLIERIQKISDLSPRITLFNMDCVEFIDQILPDLEARALIYFDPPYYIKGNRLYRNSYSDQDHVEIAALVRQLNTNWIVSYDNTPRILELYQGLPQLIYEIRYSARNHRLGDEIIFFSPALNIPSREIF